MTTKAIDKYSQGKYNDSDGNFDFDNVDIGGLFWESTIEALVEKGLGGKADNIMKEISKQDKVIAKKLSMLEDQVARKAPKKITKGIARDTQRLQKKNMETFNTYIREKTREKIKTGTTSKIINNEYENRKNN